MKRDMANAWHRRPGASRVLRLGGCALLLLAWVGGRELVALAHHGEHGMMFPLAFLSALLEFLAVCVGAALATMGAHLFDDGSRPADWQTLPVPRLDGDTAAMRDASTYPQAQASEI